jgi:hypothetical protein
VRVPEPNYRKNLIRINEVFAQQDVPVVFITAPSAHLSLGVPDYLVSQGFVPNESFAQVKHARYNNISVTSPGTWAASCWTWMRGSRALGNCMS